jgi:hypothetical protein
MRSAAFASLFLVAALIGACTAVDDFSKYKFVEDAGTDDLGGLPSFGQACSDVCATGPAPSRPLSCFKMFGNKTVPGGMCTRSCNAVLGAVACNDYPDAVCATVEGMDVCLPRCDPTVGRNCRNNYSCCDSMMVVAGPGACAPTTTNLCH